MNRTILTFGLLLISLYCFSLSVSVKIRLADKYQLEGISSITHIAEDYKENDRRVAIGAFYTEETDDNEAEAEDDDAIVDVMNTLRSSNIYILLDLFFTCLGFYSFFDK